jgi:hypothetical protein
MRPSILSEVGVTHDGDTEVAEWIATVLAWN